MTNEELIYDIQTGTGDRNEKLLLLFDQNHGLIYKLITPYLGTLEEADLMQYAFLALYPAIDSYDPGKGLFMSYYPYHLRNTLREALRDSNGTDIPYHLYGLIRKHDKYISDYQSKTGQKPTIKHICKALDITPKKLHDIRKAKRILTEARSIDDPVPGADDLIYADMIPSNEDIETDVLDRIEQSEIRKDIQEALSLLPDDIKRVILLYYIEGLPSKRIMEAMNIAYDDCRRKRERGLTLLKRDTRIKRRLKEYRSEHNLYCCGLNSFTNNGSQVERIAVSVVSYERYLRSIEEHIRKST